MNKLLLPILLCISFQLFAQTDDIPNYRSTRENFKKMVEKDIRADLASYALAGIDESLNKNPLPSIPATNITDSFIEFSQDSFYIKISIGNFEKEKHKLNYYNEKYLVKIDNKAFMGTNFTVPQKTITAVTFVSGKDTVKVPPAAIADLYEPVLSYYDRKSGAQKTHCAVYMSADKQRFYIYMINGSGKGSYEVTWVIQNKSYLRRVVDWGFEN